MHRVPLQQKILQENERIAGELREAFRQHGVLCLNFIGSPGAGKTTLLERTLEGFPSATRVAVLTGDIQTEIDARRLRRFGFPVRQIATGGTCHLDARMVQQALGEWKMAELELLLIENVGSLICPAAYDLGEAAKIVVMSVAEGEDKPLKYPSIFFKAELLILTKSDLLPHVPFEGEIARDNAHCVHPGLEILQLSCITGAGLPEWQMWLEHRRAALNVRAAAG